MNLMLPYPISVNVYWRSFRGRVVKSKAARDYIDAVQWKAKSAGIKDPLTGKAKVVLKYFPKKPKVSKGAEVRSMDIDNVAKVAIDCLQGIAYLNDNQIVHLSISKEDPIEGGGLEVEWCEA